MTPHFEAHDYPEGTQYIGVGYPQDARKLIAETFSNVRSLRAGFSGQITHQRRTEMVENLEGLDGVYLNKTEGFTQGLNRSDYYRLLTDSITVPAPSGPVTLDSFRAYEALEAGAVPILDLECPVEQNGYKYWNTVLGKDNPLPFVRHWSNAIHHIRDISKRYPSENSKVFAWWQMHKREKRQAILNGVPGLDPGDITFLIPTSVIPSHPDTSIIEETVASIRFHFPLADILVMIDGVRHEQQDRTADYEEYTQRLLRLCNFEWTNVFPILFQDHQHQANMTRLALDYVRTPLICFVEHDTPLVTDWPYDWENIFELIKSGDVDMLRFHFESRIHPEHEHMMLDPDPVVLHGVRLRRTIQWSQRPHVAKADYYRKILADHFPLTGRTMIEDKMHSVAQCEPEHHTVAVYTPEGETILRSYNLDGRKDDPKFDMVYE